MKTAEKVILLFKGDDGFATAISDGLQPNPSSSLQTLKDSFDLSLEHCGIKEKASGDIIHFVDSDGLYQVSILLLQKYEPPILACAVNEVITSVAGENSLNMPTLIIPFLVAASKLKLESKSSVTNFNVSLHGLQIGSETDTSKALLSKTQKLPSSLQIHYEPLACSVQLVRVTKIPAFILVGKSGQNQSPKSSEEEFKVLCEMGDILASISSSLSFIKEGITWNPTKTSKENVEPWRALYG